MLSSKKHKKGKKDSVIVSTLGIQLLAVTALSVIVAACVFVALGFAEAKIVDLCFKNPSYIEQETEREVKAFQRYVNENHISSDDILKMYSFFRKHRNVLIMMYDEDGMFFDSTEPHKDNKNSPKPENVNIYEIKLADKTVQANIIYLLNYKQHIVYLNIRLMISILVFVFLLLSAIKKKTDYINLISDEIKILEGGSLEYCMTIKGNDELTDLVHSIDDMRVAILARQERENQMQLASHNLVRSMSHDLRTPLTVLIGLLDIIESKKYKSEEQLEEYMKKCRCKAYQIKEMSDQLFEYFLAYNATEDELDFDVYDISVLNEMLEDWIFSISEKGYKVDYKAIDKMCNVRLDVKYFRRVFDNLFSNINKYADINYPIVICGGIENGKIAISIENTVNKSIEKVESTNIGLDVCSKIMSCHKGEFKYESTDDKFRVKLKLNVIK